MQPIGLNATYSLAANDYIAAGGSGFFVLQRNTTQVNTQVQLRDAVIDFAQQVGHPCGYDPAVASAYAANHPNSAPRADDGLTQCMTDSDCPGTDFACACPEHVGDSAACMEAGMTTGGMCTLDSGRCVLRACRDAIAGLSIADCPPSDPPGEPGARARCLCAAESRGGESCKILACFDQSIGAYTDGRLHMVTQ
jgi:5'-nucleotidase